MIERCAQIAEDEADNSSDADSAFDNGAGSCGYSQACLVIAKKLRALTTPSTPPEPDDEDFCAKIAQKSEPQGDLVAALSDAAEMLGCAAQKLCANGFDTEGAELLDAQHDAETALRGQA